MRNTKSGSPLRRVFPSPALIVAFVALFAAMGGFGYAAVKMKPNSVKTKNIRNGAVTTDKIADGAVTTPKLAPDAVAPNALSAMNADKLAGAAPGECQTGWLKASFVFDTSVLTEDQPNAVVPGFNCASNAEAAIQIHRDGTGVYTVQLAGIDSGVAVTTSAGAGALGNAVTAASRIENGAVNVRIWTNSDGHTAGQPDSAPPLVDGRAFGLLAF